MKIYRLPDIITASGVAFSLWPWVRSEGGTWERFATEEEARCLTEPERKP